MFRPTTSEITIPLILQMLDLLHAFMCFMLHAVCVNEVNPCLRSLACSAAVRTVFSAPVQEAPTSSVCPIEKHCQRGVPESRVSVCVSVVLNPPVALRILYTFFFLLLVKNKR